MTRTPPCCTPHRGYCSGGSPACVSHYEVAPGRIGQLDALRFAYGPATGHSPRGWRCGGGSCSAIARRSVGVSYAGGVTVLDAVAGFAVVAGLLTLVPGVDTALVLRASLARDRGYAAATAFGVTTGVMLWGIAAAAGISALLTASQAAYRVLTIAGAVYMLWLGASLLWKSFRASPSEVVAASRAPARDLSRWRGWSLGLGSNVLNPKAGVFYIAVIPQFLPAGVSPLLMGAVLAGVHCVLFLSWCVVLILGSGYARRWLNTPRSLAAIDRVTGVVLIGFGGKLTIDFWSTGPIPVAAMHRP